MLQVQQLVGDVWRVSVIAATHTEHQVRVTSADVQRFSGGRGNAAQLLEASFRFLLEREPNTSILREFELPVISRYFPEYEREIGRYLAKSSTEH
ncbi:MAG: hypothetical protein H0V56_08475 [Chthoniobacterales bacterium]|nr:hypothetical protein [Chthoniobacterales bacterium]